MFFHHVNEMFLPYDIPEASASVLKIAIGLIDFTGCYFHWWPSLILSMLQMLLGSLGRVIFFEMPLDSDAIVKTIINMMSAGSMVWFCHIVISYLGKIFVEAEILRKGND